MSFRCAASPVSSYTVASSPRMGDDRLPKIIFYGQFSRSARSQAVQEHAESQSESVLHRIKRVQDTETDHLISAYILLSRCPRVRVQPCMSAVFKPTSEFNARQVDWKVNSWWLFMRRNCAVAPATPAARIGLFPARTNASVTLTELWDKYEICRYSVYFQYENTSITSTTIINNNHTLLVKASWRRVCVTVRNQTRIVL